MKLSMLFLIPVLCFGCGSPPITSYSDSGEDSSESDGAVDPDAGHDKDPAVGQEAGSPNNCDCYTCPYGLGCRPSTGLPPPNPTTMHYPHGDTIM